MASLFVPPPGNTVSVRIVDSTSYLTADVDALMGPPMPGYPNEPGEPVPCLCFLIEHSSGRKLLYDLGTRKDYQNLSPVIFGMLKLVNMKVEVHKNVIEILEEGGVRGDEIEGIIWSHWHFDHIGDVSTFPPSVSTIVGPGFKGKELLPYPGNKKSCFVESDFANRKLVEIPECNFDVKIGRFQAHDYFGDGSFYILYTPGHTLEHISGLARTSKDPDTFIFMGGDLCHHPGEIRPSPHLPIPLNIEPNPFSGFNGSSLAGLSTCPASWLEPLQSSRGRSLIQPFFDMKEVENMHQAIDTVQKTQEADAKDNVWFIYAHDKFLDGAVDFFPKHVNDWKRKNLAQRLKWTFIRDFKGAIEHCQVLQNRSDKAAQAPTKAKI